MLACIMLLFFPQTVAGAHRELTPAGTTYAVVEPPVVAELLQGYPALDLHRIGREHDRYQPANLQPLPRAEQNRTFTVEMTHTLDQDLLDAQGQILYPRGFKFNPLRYTRLAGGLVVIDGSDPQQVDWFQTSPYVANRRATLLLTGGSAAELRRQWQRPVYYLTGDLAQRLRLAAVPSVILEQNKTLVVHEIRIDDEN